MVRWREGTVTGLRRRWRGAVELDVTIGAQTVRALAYPALVGEPEPGDRVLLNVGALALGLGTGGYAFVVALPDRLPPDPPHASGAGGGARNSSAARAPRAGRPDGRRAGQARGTPRP